MKKICSLFLITLIMCILWGACNIQGNDSDLIAKEKPRGMKTNKKVPVNEPVLGIIKAHDGIDLGYASYVPEVPQACLIFYHGSGVNGLAGYTYMAEKLATKDNIATYLFDIRGHGRSGGPRGHVTHPSDVWHDVVTAMEYVQTCFPDRPLFLGGHSGGASMLLNYQLWKGKKDPHGYCFVAPAFGPQAAVNRTRAVTHSKRRSFVEINHWVLLIHYLTGGYIGGDWLAATFHYPDHLVADRGFITRYTANMVSALAPSDVVRSLQQIAVSLQMYIADQDELFDPVKTDYFLDPIMHTNKHITTTHVQAHHLTILGSIHDYMGAWIKNRL